MTSRKPVLGAALAAALNAVASLLCSLSGEPALAGSVPAEVSDATLAAIRPEAIRADMQFLADDLLEGRGTGTRGHLLAAQFIASQFESMGLAPAGDHGT